MLRPAHSRSRPKRPFPSRASTGSLPPRSSRLLPAGTTVAGWELHPLKIDTFARRTLSSVTTIVTPQIAPLRHEWARGPQLGVITGTGGDETPLGFLLAPALLERAYCVQVCRAVSRSPDQDTWLTVGLLKHHGDIRSSRRRGQEARAERGGETRAGIRRGQESPAPSAGVGCHWLR
jgi:hypothetical protein